MTSSTTTTTSVGGHHPICIDRSLVDRHFAGTIASRDERLMREHLIDCDTCRAHYRRHLLFATLDPTSITAEERIGRGLELRPRPRPGLLLLTATLIAVAAAIVLFVLPPASSASSSENHFAARGSPSTMTTSSSSSSSSQISVYRIATAERGDGDKPAMLVGSDAPLGPRDELAFAYQNADAKTHLMIFGVDERGRVYWFHPAWSNEVENPTAISIETDKNPHELREAIRHQLAGERLEIHGLFLDGPLTVREAEAAVRSRANETGPVMVAGGVDHVIMFGMLR